MSNVNRLWVLGASDPEVAAIEKLLQESGEKVAYAFVGDARVHPGNAYKGDTLKGVLDAQMITFDEFVFVECDVPVIRGYIESEWYGSGQRVVKVDHHRPGDPGYGREPREFLAASSIGQVYLILVGETYFPLHEKSSRFEHWPNAEGREVWWIGHSYYPEQDGNPPGDPTPMLDGLVPSEIVLAAAADHCLEAAYRGKCPGVDPDRLMQWRAESRAAFQKRSVEDVLTDVQYARRMLRQAVGVIPGQKGGCPDCNYSPDGCEECNYSGGIFPEFADFRGKQIPELPEAAAREGIPFISTVKEKDGREKVVLQAAPEDLVRKFLAGEIVHGLSDYYGDPARGFAGGYTPKG